MKALKIFTLTSVILTVLMLCSCFFFSSGRVNDTDQGNNDVEDNQAVFTLNLDIDELYNNNKTMDEMVNALLDVGYVKSNISLVEIQIGDVVLDKNPMILYNEDGTTAINLTIYELESNEDANYLLEDLKEEKVSEVQTIYRDEFVASTYEFNTNHIVKDNFLFVVEQVMCLPSNTSTINADTLLNSLKTIDAIDAYLESKGYNKNIFNGVPKDMILEEVNDAFNNLEYPVLEYALYLLNKDNNYFSSAEVISFETESEAELFLKNFAIGNTPSYFQHPTKELIIELLEVSKAHSGGGLYDHIYSTEQPVCDGYACEVDHYTLGVCKCGEMEEDIEENRTYVKATNTHKPTSYEDKRILKKPSCIAVGIEQQYCIYCNKNLEIEIPIASDAHSYNESNAIRIDKEPSCVEDGYGEYICVLCNKTIEGVIQGGHIYNTDDFPTINILNRTCLRCNKGTLDVIPQFPALYSVLVDNYTFINVSENADEQTVRLSADNQVYNVSICRIGNSVLICLDGFINFDKTYQLAITDDTKINIVQNGKQ